MKTVTKSTELVEICNLCDYPIYFKLKAERGDAKVDPYVGYPDYLSLEELQAQIRARNPLLIGVDGRGNHASIAICDEAVRAELFHLRDDEVTTLLTLDMVKDLLAIDDQDEFATRLQKLVVTSAEKRMIGRLANEAGIDNLAAWKGRLVAKASDWMPNIFPNFNESQKPAGYYN